MGGTAESFRLALEEEISRWSGFARVLRKPDREAFEELMGICRAFASENYPDSSPIMFEPMVMSILLFQQEQLQGLEKVLDALKQRSS